ITHSIQPLKKFLATLYLKDLNFTRELVKFLPCKVVHLALQNHYQPIQICSIHQLTKNRVDGSHVNLISSHEDNQNLAK
ncbi:hypothetical protein Tsubulata_001445, partial [Turnera subulata]